MTYSADEIARIVSSVVEQIEQSKSINSKESSYSAQKIGDGEGLRGSYSDIGTCISRANEAFKEFRKMSVSIRESIIREIRSECLKHLDSIAKMAHEETGLGRYLDKVEKNRLVIEKTPGTEDLHPTAYSGDYGLTIREGGAYGVVGAITPTTNPTETIINNSIGMIAAGNAVVFNPHPRAKKCCAFVVNLINGAVLKRGKNLCD